MSTIGPQQHETVSEPELVVRLYWPQHLRHTAGPQWLLGSTLPTQIETLGWPQQLVSIIVWAAEPQPHADDEGNSLEDVLAALQGVQSAVAEASAAASGRTIVPDGGLLCKILGVWQPATAATQMAVPLPELAPEPRHSTGLGTPRCKRAASGEPTTAPDSIAARVRSRKAARKQSVSGGGGGGGSGTGHRSPSARGDTAAAAGAADETQQQPSWTHPSSPEVHIIVETGNAGARSNDDGLPLGGNPTSKGNGDGGAGVHGGGESGKNPNAGADAPPRGAAKCADVLPVVRSIQLNGKSVHPAACHVILHGQPATGDSHLSLTDEDGEDDDGDGGGPGGGRARGAAAAASGGPKSSRVGGGGRVSGGAGDGAGRSTRSGGGSRSGESSGGGGSGSGSGIAALAAAVSLMNHGRWLAAAVSAMLAGMPSAEQPLLALPQTPAATAAHNTWQHGDGGEAAAPATGLLACSELWRELQQFGTAWRRKSVSSKAGSSQAAAVLDAAIANKAMLRRVQRHSAAVVSHAAGAAVGTWLLWRRRQIAAWLAHCASSLAWHIIDPQVRWLMGAPAGLKLHAELSALLGGAMLWGLQRCALLAGFVAPLLPLLTGAVGLLAMVAGLAAAFSAAADLIAVASLPLRAAHLCMALMTRAQLRSMLAMWRLILGHGKPRMFAMLAAQRAALAAAPRGPQTARPAPRPAPSGSSGGAAAMRQGGPGPAAGSSKSTAPAGAGYGPWQPMSRRLWMRTAAATAMGLCSPQVAHRSAADGDGSGRNGGSCGSSGGGSDSPGKAGAAKGGSAQTQLPLQLQLRPPPGLLSSGDGIEMEHLIVGVLLGTPLLFLLPTTLVFHAFALLLAAGTAAVQAALAAAATVVHENPAALLALRLLRPGLFAAGISFEALPSPIISAGLTNGGNGRQSPIWGSQAQSAAATAAQQGTSLDFRGPQAHLRLVSHPQGWAAVPVPCCAAAVARARQSWQRSGVRLPW